MKPALTVKIMLAEVSGFCKAFSRHEHSELLGVTDGKKVGTYIETQFQQYLAQSYNFSSGNSAKGIDLPDVHTDLKATFAQQPQSSCPFKDTRQKVYGLGYNLLVFVYDRVGRADASALRIVSCAFIDESRTGDFTMTMRLREMLKDGANKEDLVGFLRDRNLPGDDIALEALAGELLKNPPRQGYLTISNALQWRLQYSRVIALNNTVPEIVNYEF